MHCWYQLIQRALSSLQVCGSAHVGHDRSQHWTTQAWFERHVLEFSKGFLWFFHEFLWFSMLFYAFEVFVSHPAERGHQCVLIAMLISHRPYGIFPGLQVRQWRRGWQAVGQGCCGTSLCSIRPGNWCFWLDLFFFKERFWKRCLLQLGWWAWFLWWSFATTCFCKILKELRWLDCLFQVWYWRCRWHWCGWEHGCFKRQVLAVIIPVSAEHESTQS